MIPKIIECRIKWKDNAISENADKTLWCKCAIGIFDVNDPDHALLDDSIFYWFDENNVNGDIQNLVGFRFAWDFVVKSVWMPNSQEVA